MLDLHRLLILREVHGRGTVRAAADALGYSPSAVSQQLSSLEREAGAVLLERVGRNVRLTDAGHVLVRHAMTLLEQMEAAEAEVAAVAAGQIVGTVRVAAFQSAFVRIVAPAVSSLALTHPDIRVEAFEAEVEQGAPAVRLQQYDVLVGDEYDDQPRVIHAELHRERLLRERIRVVLPAEHPEAAADHVSLGRLADMAWAGCQPGTGHRSMQERACRQLGGFEPDVRYSSDDLLILLEMARTVGAAVLLPELTLGHSGDGVTARPLADGGVGREIFLLTRRARTPAVEAVCEALRVATAGAAAVGAAAS